MDFSNDGGMKFPIRPCNEQPINGTIDGFPSDSTCNCNSCDKSCNFDTNTTLPILEGFSWLTIGIVYLIVGIATGLIYLCKCYYRRKHPNFYSRSSSFDSNHLIDGHASNNTNHTRNSANNINNNLTK